MSRLEEKIGYHFQHPELLQTALTHSSYANEHSCESYERLEFLGDSVLGFLTAEFLYEHEPAVPEGRMTRLRAELVCEQSLYTVAMRLGISGNMKLGKSAERTGERKRQSILADMVEAILAAVYLDGGMEPARIFVRRELLDRADLSEECILDHKSALQELLQKNGECSIQYRELSESGPDHDKVFTFCVEIDGVLCGEGSGRTKKEAEQAAAGKALERLQR
jgi:ribonuclease-3